MRETKAKQHKRYFDNGAYTVTSHHQSFLFRVRMHVLQKSLLVIWFFKLVSKGVEIISVIK